MGRDDKSDGRVCLQDTDTSLLFEGEDVCEGLDDGQSEDLVLVC